MKFTCTLITAVIISMSTGPVHASACALRLCTLTPHLVSCRPCWRSG